VDEQVMAAHLMAEHQASLTDPVKKDLREQEGGEA
jgi:hypothetical protein